MNQSRESVQRSKSKCWIVGGATLDHLFRLPDLVLVLYLNLVAESHVHVGLVRHSLNFPSFDRACRLNHSPDSRLERMAGRIY